MESVQVAIQQGVVRLEADMARRPDTAVVGKADFL